MARLDRWLALLDVRRDEARPLRQLFVLYFVIIAAVVLIQSMAFGLFLAAYGAGRLPYAYLVIALLGSLAAVGYLRLGARVGFARSVTLNLGFLAAGCVALWLGLVSPAHRWVVFLLPVWFQLFITLANLVVWPLALRIFDVRQSKRLFGLIGAGNWLANSIGGLVVAPLVAWVGPSRLLLFAGLLTFGAVFLLRGILAGLPDAGAGAGTGAEERAPTRTAARAPSRAESIGRYGRLIFGYTALWWLAFYFVDNVFYAQAAGRFPDAVQLTAFIGRFLSVIGVVALVTTVVLTSRVLQRFGLPTALLAMPVLVSGALVALAFGGVLGAPVVVLFLLAAGGKLFNVSLGFSLTQTAHSVMYGAMPQRLRERVQTVAEGIVQPLSIGVAGVALLVLTRWAHLDGIGLAGAFAPLAAAWLALTWLVARAYPRALADALVRRRLGASWTAPTDATSLALLRANLRSPHAGAALYALERLEDAGAPLDDADWRSLLDHPSAEVRLGVLSRWERGAGSAAPAAEDPRRRLAPELAQRLAQEPDRSVRAALLGALAASGGPDALPRLRAALENPEPDVRDRALAELLRAGEADATNPAAAALAALLGSAATEERTRAAEVLGSAGGPSAARALRPLLEDPDLVVRVAAVRAAGRIGDPDLVPAVVAAVREPRTTRAAERALASWGDDALDEIGRALADPALPGAAAVALVRACAAIGTPRALELVEANLVPSTGNLRWRVLDALVAHDRHAGDPGPLWREVRATSARIAELDAALEALTRAALPDDGDPLAPVGSALREARFRERDCLLLLLALLLDRATVLDARAALARGTGHETAQALELLEGRLPRELRAEVLARLSPAAVPGAADAPRTDLETHLAALLAEPASRAFGPWVAACALHAVGSLRLAACAAAVAGALDHPDPLVRETARWAHARLQNDPQEGRPMLTTLERVLVLRTVDIFQGTPDAVLADVAALLEEQALDAGDVVIRQGDVGDSMYVLLEGRVGVYDGERLLDTLEGREVFGEMALIDPEARVATVTALEPTRVLRLAQAPFTELLLERPEVGIGMLRVLARRLRARIGDLRRMPPSVAAASPKPAPAT